MKNTLIELNPTEQFLANTNLTFTLKDVADQYGKLNKNLVRDFNKMISELSEEKINQLYYKPIKYVDEQSKTRPTIRVDIKTLIWFISKFDHNLRLEIVNFAFSKIDKQKELEKLEAIKKAKSPRVDNKGWSGVRGCIGLRFGDVEHDINETDVIEALIWRGVIKTKVKTTIIRQMTDNFNGIAGYNGNQMPMLNPDVVRSVYDEWIKAGKPIRSEHDRLIEEFEQVSNYYKEKIEKAKKE